MSRKYELTNDTIEVGGATLHRIKALRNFKNVKAGDLGGYIEIEKNLSHKGNCWVYDDAKVYGYAIVSDNAVVRFNTSIYGHAVLLENADISGGLIFDNAVICGQAIICGNTVISGNAVVSGNAGIYDNAEIYGNAVVSGNAGIYGNTNICGNSRVYGYIGISSNNEDIFGNSVINNDTEESASITNMY